jgi:hypothetical protein
MELTKASVVYLFYAYEANGAPNWLNAYVSDDITSSNIMSLGILFCDIFE